MIPELITPRQKKKWAEKNAHIPTSEIQQDIRDTQAEITVLYREIDGLRTIGDKVSMFRADGKEAGIREREEFIRSLEAILEVREQNNKL